MRSCRSRRHRALIGAATSRIAPVEGELGGDQVETGPGEDGEAGGQRGEARADQRGG